MPSTMAKLTPEMLDQVVKDACGLCAFESIDQDSAALRRIFQGPEGQHWLMAMQATFNATPLVVGQSLLILNAFRLGWKCREAMGEVEALEKL